MKIPAKETKHLRFLRLAAIGLSVLLMAVQVLTQLLPYSPDAVHDGQLACGAAAPVKAAEDVRGLCSFGYIDGGGTLRRWQDGQAVPVAEDVISADCSDSGAIYISDGSTLCAAGSDNALIRRDSMLRFW